MPTAYRHTCSANISVLCNKGDGKAPRKRCKYCKSEITTQTGMWGVFVWTRDNFYPASNALSTHATLAKAETAAGSEYVVRWIP